ncbi:MAG: DUF1003 domain-containing protein [Nitrospirae bacterium]|nr:DUF1003 domain-containing protein [Nitrospirota bacterium]MDP2278375.1 DUF1003 domain-containing protein [Nitrospirota bacterium]
METLISSISKKEYPKNELISGKSIRIGILNEIKKDHPDFTEDQYVSLSELNFYRQRYIENTMKEELGSLTNLEHEVLESFKEGELIAENIDETFKQKLTFGQRLADKIGNFGGSWSFISLFMIFLFAWISINVYVLVQKPFDPYPFIFLNLILSCLAAMQAPVIMMSQNRLEEKDRERSKHDYKVNLKAELEIRMLNEKVDHLILNQQQKLLEIQQIQIEMMEDIMNELSRDNK